MPDTETSPLAADLLKGVPEIAAYLGESERRVYYLCEGGVIPVFRVGRRWHARKSELNAFYSGEAASSQGAS